ncbi:T9SS type A sorting domain-containing protein [Pedobacter sp. HMF7647]|uniref:T9SS type A sorting domain-containing protein n=1 Tax=Hufsiella arboris TaxID=2695275 RepID=A0A7K1Y9N4_9SPHI|nr:malectin domain-containing carbohydrate-binding protein [Hufsiella arboris]MXV51303.1 T9SS type A sorting domain-containing protein [Hufsiella arboris]
MIKLNYLKVFSLTAVYKSTTALIVVALLHGNLYSAARLRTDKNLYFTNTGRVAPPDTCAPVSTLSCSVIKVNSPYVLTFDSATTGTILDKNGLGTGFTTVNTYSGTRLAVDGSSSNPAVPGYEPSRITLTGGRLQLLAAKGIDYQANNNQLNSLGVQISAAGKVQIEVDIINPYNGTQSQQAGIWYGLSDKTYIKLGVTGNKVELRKELNDASSTVANANPDQRVTAAISGLNTQTVRLRLVIDSVAQTAEGFYSTNGGSTYISTGASGYSTSSVNISAMNVTSGNVYAAIFATYRNATSAVTYTFDNFSVTSESIPSSFQTVNINFQPASVTPPAGYKADTGLPFDATRKYGWISPTTGQPVSLEANMRLRSGTGDIKQLTVVQMQANTSGQVPGTWEYSVPNGTYRVKVSAGDNGYYDSDHQINIEGLPVITDFIPTSSNKFLEATATVQVNDGKLTVDSKGGVNTKMNYVSIGEATTIADNTPPTASARFVGTASSPNVYSNEVQIIVTSRDAGGSGIASLQYSINNGTYVNYTVPFTLATAGNYTMSIKAVDGNGNQTITSAYNFSIVQAASGAYMVLKNMDNFPADDQLVFSRIQVPWRRTSPDTTAFNSNHDKVRLRINNKGTGKLTITSLALSNPTAWKIVSIGTDTLATLPISISTNTYKDVTIQFIAQNAATRLRILTDTLYISSNDDLVPFKKIGLRGIWQAAGEGVAEPYAQQIITAFGFKTNTGYGHDDGNIDGSTIVPNSNEITASFFVRADASKPVTIYQMAAYHGCCASIETISYYSKGTTTTKSVFTHNPLDGQSVIPRLQSSSTSPAQGSFVPTGTFGLKVGSAWSDRTKNYNGLIGIRFWKVLDANGNIVPNAYIIGGDYLGTTFTNYDYQDNVYYVDNIRPDSGSVNYSPLASTTGSSVNFDTATTGSTTTVSVTLKNMGISYPDGSSDPSIKLTGVKIVGPNAGEFSVGTLSTTNLAIQATTSLAVRFVPNTAGIKNAALLVSYNSSALPLRIPLYGISNSSTKTVSILKRIKSGSNAAVTIGGNTYEADNSYRQGSIKLDNQVTPSDVAGTDDDILYQTYLSANADLAETRYAIPLANGNYAVRLHFVENYWTTVGSRVFNTTIEDKLVLPNFDIFNEIGYRVALVKDFNVTISDGTLNIKFNPTANRVAISGIEIFQITDVTQPVMLASLKGETALTKVTEVKAPTPSLRKITLYPNPISGNSFYVNASNFASRDKVQLVISDISGRVLQTQTFITDESGSANVYLTMKTTPEKGVYIVQARSQTSNVNSRLLVQ